MQVNDVTNQKVLDFSDAFAKAFDCLENSYGNYFVTGQAGTGKSTLLRYFRDHTSKNVAILAPTGVAAVNIKGQTIHSFFRFRPDVSPENVAEIRLRKEQRKIYQNLDAIVIDEVSMLRADVLDSIEAFLKQHGPSSKKPFGGVQIIFFGDLHQLPPVVRRHDHLAFQQVYDSPYFFSAKSYPSLNLERLVLDKIYRQSEEDFIELLGAIRENRIDGQVLERLNSRHDRHFAPDEGDFYIYLTTTNAMADRINKSHLTKLRTKSYDIEGDVMGEFEGKVLPTHLDLQLKFDAQVMLLNNDPQGRWINGSIGKVVNVDHMTEIVTVKLANDKVVDVEPYTWDMYRYFYNEEAAKLESDIVGSFRQFPLKLAWAVTIHKSQGQTFSRVVVDLGTGAFAPGQVYVALSRCSTFQGLVLTRPVFKRDFMSNQRIVDYLQESHEK